MTATEGSLAEGPVAEGPVAEAPATDGRHLRRDRNRQAVVAALLELYREGNLRPSSDEIADRAGTSARSLFRYFDDIDALVRAAIEQQQHHLAPLYELSVGPSDPLEDRIAGLVAARTRLLEAMGPVGRVARNLAVTQAPIAAELGRIRRALREQVAVLFAAELARLDAHLAASTLAALDVALSWEAHHLLRHDQGLDGPAAAAATTLTVRRLLGLEG